MALIKCKNCGKDISDTSDTCIHCGSSLIIRKKSNDSTNWFKRHKFLSVLLIGISVFLVCVILCYIDSGIMVTDNSMFPTLKQGKRKLYNKTGKIERFDIVVFINENGGTLIRRVYGLPGETISFNGSEIHIGSKKIFEDKYANGNMTENGSITLKSDEYYVLADSRDYSDSRNFGPIKKSSIKGKLYGGNNQEIELIEEEISKDVEVSYEFENQNVFDEKYNLDIDGSYTSIVVKGKKENVDKIEYAAVVIDFKVIENVRIGNTMLYDLPIIVYDKNGNEISGVDIIPSNADVSITLTEKR